MAKLIYSMLVSLDGYTEDEHGHFGWGAPEDAEVHSYINELASSFGTYLYGRRMYETMVYWETAHTVRDQPRFVLPGGLWRQKMRFRTSRRRLGAGITRRHSSESHGIAVHNSLAA